MKLFETIDELAKELVPGYECTQHIYSFSNENVSGYVPFFDLKGKSLLTVGSSCDQAINACVAGCEDVTVFDICELTKPFYYLKLASLLSLERDEFIRFLCNEHKFNGFDELDDYLIRSNPDMMSRKIYDKVRDTLKALDNESFKVWEYIFGNYNNSHIVNLFRTDVFDRNTLPLCNNYLKNDEIYYETRRILLSAHITIIEGDIFNPQLDRKYDNVWLSNIGHYLDEEELEKLFKAGEGLLTDNGRMMYCYFWQSRPRARIYGDEIQIPEGVQMEQRHFPCSSENPADNMILVYEKPKQLKKTFNQN